MSWLGALGLGGAVGLGVAVPLGAIGVLLLQTGMTRGWRLAAVAALGVAAVDLGYAVVAVLAGAAVSGALGGHERVVQIVGAVVLALVVVRGVVGLFRRPDEARAADDVAPLDGVPVDRVPLDGVPVHGVPLDGVPVHGVPLDGARADKASDAPFDRAGPAFLRFFALTAINPLTVIYFTAVAAGLSDRLATPADRIAFVLGIGCASAFWQLALAGAGALLGARVGPRLRTGLALVGYGVVGGFAVALAAG